MVLAPEDDGVEDCGDEHGYRQGLIPLVTNDTLDVKQMFKEKIHNRNKDDMEADDDQRTDG